MKLTSAQFEVLDFLRNGGIMSVDRHNTAWCGDRAVQLNTRSISTSKKLITRVDKSRSIQSKGNGYRITEKELEVLQQQSPPVKIVEKFSSENVPPTEKQLKYASDLGVNIPVGANIAEVSDLISAKLDGDEPSNVTLLQLAQQFKVWHTRFTGKRSSSIEFLTR